MSTVTDFNSSFGAGLWSFSKVDCLSTVDLSAIMRPWSRWMVISTILVIKFNPARMIMSGCPNTGQVGGSPQSFLRLLEPTSFRDFQL